MPIRFSGEIKIVFPNLLVRFLLEAHYRLSPTNPCRFGIGSKHLPSNSHLIKEFMGYFTIKIFLNFPIVSNGSTNCSHSVICFLTSTIHFSENATNFTILGKNN